MTTTAEDALADAERDNEQYRAEARELRREMDGLRREVALLRARLGADRYLVVACFDNHDVPLGLVESPEQAGLLCEAAWLSPPRHSPFAGDLAGMSPLTVQVLTIDPCGHVSDATRHQRKQVPS